MPCAESMPTRAEAPPPRPLKRATVCGICIILTLRAIVPPMSAPIRMAAYTVHTVSTPLNTRVAATPTSMARAESRLPATEVFTRLIMEMPASTTTDNSVLRII